ncbi:hypothetical protein HDR60_05110, partial [bacterium]|nr:hypothetical protein [bacterium]
MKKVSILTLSLVMLVNSSVVFSAPRKRRNAGGVIPTATTTTTTLTPITLEEVEIQNAVEELEVSMIVEKEKEISDLLSTLSKNVQDAKSYCLGIKEDLKNIQILAGVSTGISAVGTITSGGALATGIIKNVKDKKIEENKQENNDIEKLLKMSDTEFEQAILNGEVSRVLSELSDNVTRENVKEKQIAVTKEIDKETKKSQTLGNVRTGLMAGSIATSATSTITSGINIKKLDDLINKMKDCDKSANQIKSDISMIESEIDNVDDLKDNASFTKAKNITQS